jgi:hypothetical protein
MMMGQAGLAARDDVTLKMKLSGVQLAIWQLTGEKATEVWAKDHVRLRFTAAQRDLLQDLLTKKLQARPGKIRLEVAPVVVPPVLKVYGKYILLGALLLFFTGRRIGYAQGMRVE